MSLYINTTTNDYPLYEGDIRLLHPEIGVEFILPSGYAVVEEGVIPQTASTKRFDELLPEPTESGIYTRVFVERDLTEEELSRQAILRAQYEKPQS
jgi:hypothetical protein